ncbi:MAG: isoprenylcysteine carboxylmethyltransferase family protein [Clostridia bacterium]|nr:isoprenylcysteine carboxylmethyltransferase family protein [Clostridia bacterium]
MTKKLFFSALVKFSLGILLVGILIFLPAGSLSFVNGWIFMGVLFIPIFLVGVLLMLKNPALLQKRLDAKESQKEQNLVIKLSGLMFIIGFVLPGLGYRFGWYTLPYPVTLTASAIFLIGYCLFAEVLRENTYLSRTIEVQENQTVIDTGLYGIVRHPMYTATLLMFLSMPLILGSLYSLAVFLAYPFIIVLRIKKEEELLTKELDGYQEYKQKVKYRLIPFVW